MTPLDAVAAAIRERLLAGRPAPLPGLGTLIRQHVASRIQEGADGTRVLMPPGETIGLAETDANHESLALAFGRLQGVDGVQAVSAYRDAMDQLEARLAVTGEVRLPGVGLLRRTSGGVILGVEADLLTAVNRTYEGLTPIGAPPTPSPEPTADSAEAAQEITPEPSTEEPTSAASADLSAVGAAEPEMIARALNAPSDAVGTEPIVGDAAADVSGVAPMESPTVADSAPMMPPEAETETTFDALAAQQRADVPWFGDDVVAEEPASEDALAEADAPLLFTDDLTFTTLGDAPSEPSATQADDAAEPSVGDAAQPERPYTAPPASEGPSPGAPYPPPIPVYPVPGHHHVPPVRAEMASDTIAFSDLDSDSSFVDDETLDADLDDLAVPFGSGTPLSETFPPTPSSRQPDTTLADSGDSEIVGDAAETSRQQTDADATGAPPTMAPAWDASASDAPQADVGSSPDDVAPLDPIPGDLLSTEIPSSAQHEIEEASYEVVDENATQPSVADLVADDVATPAGSGESAPTGPVIERIGPSAELGALMADPNAAPLSDSPRAPLQDNAGLDVAEPDVAATPVADTSRGFPWWLVALVLLLLIVAALVWAWPRYIAPQLSSAKAAPPALVDLNPQQSQRATLTPARAVVSSRDVSSQTSGATGIVADEPTASLSPTKSQAAPDRPARPTSAVSGGNVSGRPGLGQAPTPGYAISPPRLVGLVADDVDAFSGRSTVDPQAVAWTLVVLSTPSLDDARALSVRYRGAGYRTGVLVADDGRRKMHRVAVGQFSDRDQALRLRDRLPPQAPADSWPLDLRTL